MPSGRLLIAGPDENDSWFLNSANTAQPLSGQWTSIFPQQDRQRLFGSAVLLPNAPNSRLDEGDADRRLERRSG